MGLTNAQYDRIMRGYEKRRLSAQHELSRRREEIFSRIPEYAALDARIGACSRDYARKMLLDDSDLSIDALNREIQKLSRQKKDLLLASGYPANYLEAVYECPDCRDTGYIEDKKCHCLLRACSELLYSQSNLAGILKEENFKNFSLDYYSESIQDSVTGKSSRELAELALKRCQDFVRDFDHQPGNLFIYGDTGLGKTFLSHCIAGALMDQAHSVAYFSAFRLFETLADSSFRSNEEAATYAEQIFDCDFLIIDDLGTEMVNSFVSSRLFQVINERILKGKSTMISTNLSLATFVDTYTERVFSRISSNYQILRLAGEDIRLRKKIGTRKQA